MRNDRYVGSNISPFVAGTHKVCCECLVRLPLSQMTLIHPVPGLTMYNCPACAAAAQAHQPEQGGQHETAL